MRSQVRDEAAKSANPGWRPSVLAWCWSTQHLDCHGPDGARGDRGWESAPKHECMGGDLRGVDHRRGAGGSSDALVQTFQHIDIGPYVAGLAVRLPRGERPGDIPTACRCGGSSSTFAADQGAPNRRRPARPRTSRRGSRRTAFRTRKVGSRRILEARSRAPRLRRPRREPVRASCRAGCCRTAPTLR